MIVIFILYFFFLDEHFYHKPLAQEIGRSLPMPLTLNKYCTIVLYCINYRDQQSLILNILVSSHLKFYTSQLIFDDRVFATLVPGTNHPNYYQAFEAYQKGLCYSFPTPHDSNQSEVEQGYGKH